MTRAVTADHVMFEECLPFFRPKKIEEEHNNNTPELTGYILLDFELNQTFDFKYFKILPTHRTTFSSPYSAFIAPVILPKWLKRRHNAHLFCIALSSIVSFITSRPVKALRNDYCIGEPLDEHTIETISIQFPVLTAGPGSHNFRPSKELIESYFFEINDIVNVLLKVSYPLYTRLMRAVRLKHLAHNNKREDFSLAYYLLVSSIETVAQKAIKVPKVKHRLESQWEELANESDAINELLTEYKRLRSNDKKLRERFVDFIFKYCPPDKWNKLEHPHEYILSSHTLEEQKNWQWITQKKWDEIYPEDLQDEELKDNRLRAIISDSYKYRSKFTHEGSPPPHKQPNSLNKFFDIDYKYNEVNDKYERKQIVLANFSLLEFIAKNSIIMYAKSNINN